MTLWPVPEMNAALTWFRDIAFVDCTLLGRVARTPHGSEDPHCRPGLKPGLYKAAGG